MLLKTTITDMHSKNNFQNYQYTHAMSLQLCKESTKVDFLRNKYTVRLSIHTHTYKYQSTTDYSRHNILKLQNNW